MKSFRNWTRHDMAKKFALDTKPSCEDLNHWLSADLPITDDEVRELKRLQSKLRENADIWNEQELVMKFIALIVDKVDYDNGNYKSFANRRLSGKIDGEEVGGDVDFMIASGKYEPEEPYFCLHEYKKEKGVDNDPLGQLLIAMMTAQEINQNQYSMYGAYVMGRNWFFLTLKDRKYCISDEFVATRDDIFQIFKILKQLKNIISNMIEREATV